MSFNTWWHERTDDLEGIDKLIGEPGSMFRENLVKPGVFIVVVALLIYLVRPHDA